MNSSTTQTCVRIEQNDQYRGKQGLTYISGVSAESAGSRGLCMHIVTIPPLGRAKPHLHENHETAVYTVSGVTGMWYGEGLKEHMWVKQGDFVYIPANTPHLPYNPSETTPCVALLARTDPNEQESVTVLNVPDPGIAKR